MTTQDIKNYCKLTGKRFEEHFASSFDRGQFKNGSVINCMNADHQNYTIGVEMNDMVWYWWHSYELDGYNDESLMFKQRYSQKTGQKAAGWKTGYTAETKIAEIIKNK